MMVDHDHILIYLNGSVVHLSHADAAHIFIVINGADQYLGAWPQTKFVLRKALELNLPVIVCVNKIDRPEARCAEVVDEVLELFIDLEADESQLDCPFVFASARTGTASMDR